MAHLSDGVNVDVVLSICRMRYEGFHKEIPQVTSNSLDLLLLASSCLYPSSSFRPGLVKAKQTTLASSLDQLIWFGDEFCVWGK